MVPSSPKETQGSQFNLQTNSTFKLQDVQKYWSSLEVSKYFSLEIF